MRKRDEKIQSYMFKGILKESKHICYCEYDDNFIAVTWNGFQLYILKKNSLCFSLDKCREDNNLADLLIMTEEDKELRFTNALKVIAKEYYRKLKADDFIIWVNDKYLKDFENGFENMSYYASNPLGRILVAKPFTDKIIGCVMPIRIKDEEWLKALKYGGEEIENPQCSFFDDED